MDFTLIVLPFAVLAALSMVIMAYAAAVDFFDA